MKYEDINDEEHLTDQHLLNSTTLADQTIQNPAIKSLLLEKNRMIQRQQQEAQMKKRGRPAIPESEKVPMHYKLT